MNGVLVVDKPAGPTSHDVVALARRALGQSRIGHTGTLDPLATGVLPLVVGQACRLAQFLTADEKTYLVGVRFGLATPTYDAEGRGLDRPMIPEPAGLSAPAIEAALAGFRGTYLQAPPPYSAKKIGGVPAHRLARSRKAADIPAVEVTVHALELASYAEGLGRIRVVCSSGFYVRTLAHELGQRLGCGAHVEDLRRTRAGDFTLEAATPVDVIVAEGPAALSRLVPMQALLTSLPSVMLTDAGSGRARHGCSLGVADRQEPAVDRDVRLGDRVRMLDPAGSLIGLAERTLGGLLHPVIVLG